MQSSDRVATVYHEGQIDGRCLVQGTMTLTDESLDAAWLAHPYPGPYYALCRVGSYDPKHTADDAVEWLHGNTSMARVAASLGRSQRERKQMARAKREAKRRHGGRNSHV